MQNLKVWWSIIIVTFLSSVMISSGNALLELSYLFDGAEINTYNAGSDLDRAYTKSSSGVNHYRVKAHIRAWGNSPNPLKEETFHDCFNCLTTDDRVRVLDFYSLTVSQHISRKQITATQYQGYTSDISGYSTHGCWTNGLGC